MSLDPESLYVQLGRLVETTPDLTRLGPISAETNQWLGRAAALVEASGDLGDLVTLKVAAQNLDSVLRESNAQIVVAIVHRALARAELKAPATSQGAFIPVGESFSAFAAVSKILTTARLDVLIVDPYADAKVLTDFAVLAPEGVPVRVLSDAGSAKTSLKPAAENWRKQYGTTRPLEIRLTAARSLHDRLIAIDEVQAWTLTQSLKDFAARSPASIVRVDSETAGLKIEAYAVLWADATPL
ncbi:phosphatidylserine/phosphatidylglycerophosphate/cardiolipin synthase family protein [Burkholderia sp. BCC1047]|uniref:phosphatidylserine/phosphatidylglycerophosphate/ cardiolipin synthase family protein n=1 Tax=Burkholderia sp. BCC1047 TaxID=2676299 RepID=UPI00158BA51A|nr:phosphatidylserine/phosphatidylglycerophosphate/cardiolipin synthase family protein [Burkholderia sp. BCC1047]